MVILALILAGAWQAASLADAHVDSSVDAAVSVPREQWLPILMRVSQVVRQQTSRLGNFTCVQTVTRHSVDRKRRESRDTLRFETGVVGEREVFGWPGQELTQTSPNELVSFGASSTGDLYSTVRSAVGNREVTITGVTRNGGEMVFSYEMGSVNSQFMVGGPRASAIVGFRGEFALDPGEGRLVWLRREADAIPVEVGTRRTQTVLRFDRKANQPPFDIVPVSAVTVMEDWLGGTSTLASTWQGCAEFAVTSRISFGEEPGSAPAAPPTRLASRWLRVKSKAFSTELTGTYPLSTLTAGDSVAMQLSAAIRLTDGTELPAGTAVMARIVLNNERPNDRTRVIGLRLDPYLAGGRRVLLDAVAERVTGAEVETGVRVIRSSTRAGAAGSDSLFESSTEKLYLDRSVGAATFMLPLTAAQLPVPLTIKWRVE
ncbi:MAG: hypothetical protein NTZ56_13760 [Acidobacteria bacterium]|nr:hypothetical protein [Acidobacteriota bacterium]